MSTLNKTNNSLLSSKRGFSLLEVMIVLILMVILIGVSASMYSAFGNSSRRQERINLVERSIDETKASLRDSLTTLVGQGLGTTNGEIYSIPQLPVAGSTTDQTGKTVPIQLGIATPYKLTSSDGSINSDAITIVYSEPSLPRFPVKENIKVDFVTGKVRIALPLYLPGKLPPPPKGGTALSGNIGDLTGSSIKSNGFANSSNGNESNSIIPPHTPTPTPTPTPSPVATPAPAVPPNIPFNTTILNQSWIPDASMFHIGDTVLLINEPAYDATDPSLVQTQSRLVLITAVSQFTPTLAAGGSAYIELTFDYCNSGSCGTQFPGLTNSGIAPKVASVVVPIRLASFYLKKTKFGSTVIRNDGGVILPTGNGTFQIQGGKEIVIGESDTFVINYHLSDGTTQSTPNTPLVPWLNKITSVDILLSNSVPSGKGTEQINEQFSINFPINVRNFQ